MRSHPADYVPLRSLRVDSVDVSYLTSRPTRIRGTVRTRDGALRYFHAEVWDREDAGRLFIRFFGRPVLSDEPFPE